MSYYKRALAVSFLDDINSPLQDIFVLLLSVMSSNNYNIDAGIEFLFQGYKNEMVNEEVQFSLEVGRWYKLWNNKSYQKKQKIDTTQTRVNGKSVCVVESPLDSFTDVLKVADDDYFPNIVDRGNLPNKFFRSGIRRLKTAFRNTMKDNQESNLNLLQIHATVALMTTLP